MTEEFNLSEKIKFDGRLTDRGIIDKEDVKEFIRLLKESTGIIFDEIQSDWMTTDSPQVAQTRWQLATYMQSILDEIDKLAGDELI